MVRFGDLGVTYAVGTYTKQEGIKVKALVLENAILKRDKNGKINMEIKGDDGK